MKILATMIGERVQVVVNAKDIREVAVYRSDGAYIGTLRVEPRWYHQPHSIRTRRSINKLIRLGHISRDSRNPVGDHLLFMEARARRNRRDRARLAQQRRENGLAEASAVRPNRAGEAPATLLEKGWVNVSKIVSR
jgi:hypothetical protein